MARGLGRSYGDAALNGGGQVLGLRKLDRFLAFDEATDLKWEGRTRLPQHPNALKFAAFWNASPLGNETLTSSSGVVPCGTVART